MKKQRYQINGRVQRRAKNLVSSVKTCIYEDRLHNLTTLQTRQIRGELIDVFKISKVYKHIEANTFF
jgi:hypothetical protein